MDETTFKAIGTMWRLSHDGAPFRDEDVAAVKEWVDAFERRFSRFLHDSEVNAFRQAEAGEYKVSNEFAHLLGEADRLRALTAGVYDPAVSELLERAGYDERYSLRPGDTESFSLPKWELKGNTLRLSGPAAFDFGGIGKGYAIDRVAEMLKKRGYKHLAVEAGGDMFVSAKRKGKPWKVAIQYPGKPDMAAGVVYLKNEALAVSDTLRRTWGKWHHIVNPHEKAAVEETIGAEAVAPSAFHADCMTSALFLGSAEGRQNAAHTYRATCLIFSKDGTARKSANWRGEVF